MPSIISHVLVIGAEVHSTGLDISTQGRDVTVLFGEGAGAIRALEAKALRDVSGGAAMTTTVRAASHLLARAGT